LQPASKGKVSAGGRSCIRGYKTSPPNCDGSATETRLYELIDDHRPPGARLPAAIAGFRLSYTLEIVVRDEFASHLLLTYPKYASGTSTGEEPDVGCWTLPFLSHHVDPGLSTPLRVVSARRLFDDFEKVLAASEQRGPQDPVPHDLRRLAWQLGARDPSFEYLGSFIEIKRSYRTPELIMCYKIVRCGLWLEDDDPGMRDLADPEARQGMCSCRWTTSEACFARGTANNTSELSNGSWASP
jgi:hypothetical protein